MKRSAVGRRGRASLGHAVSLVASSSCLALVLLLSTHQQGDALSSRAHRRIPAFARKYGLRCSACHTVWPELNAFGQAFKDNGYQLGNDRDSPIYQNPGYWPVAFRTTPQVHLETTTHQPVDVVPGDPTGGQVERTVRQSGFDLSGIDILALGTLYKDVSFGLVPTIDPDGSVGIEAAFVRFDNIARSPWLNVKLGKFELDNLLSEKRIALLSANGGLYQGYHFVPTTGSNDFQLGENQLGVELMGHNANSYTRYSVALLGSTNGEAGTPTGRTYDAAFTASQAYQAGSLGLHRVGVFGYVGQRATVVETSGGEPIAGTMTNAKPFYRVGATGSFFFGNLELLPFYMHAQDDRYLATATAADQTLPPGARNAEWDDGLLEAHFIATPQLAFLGRYEALRVSRQPTPDLPSDFGNSDTWAVGVRAYPFMIARDGMAFHLEYASSRSVGTVPLSETGVGAPPLSPSTRVQSSSVMLGLDFAF